MYTTHVRSVAAIRFLEEGSHNVKMKQLIGHEDGARKTSMHELIIAKGGYSAPHRHEWDHQLVVTAGGSAAPTGAGETSPSTRGGRGAPAPRERPTPRSAQAAATVPPPTPRS